jgi:hypothetical protein
MIKLSGMPLGHSNMIPCFPFHQKAWGKRAGGSLFIVLYVLEQQQH